YDVLITPAAEQAYCLFAQTIDRSGYARGTLTPDIKLKASVPAMDPPPNLGHRDMGMGGMDHSGHDMGAMDHSSHDMSKMDTGAMNHASHDMGKMDASAMNHAGHDMGKMDTGAMNHAGHDMGKMDASAMNHAGQDMSKMDKPAMDHSGHDMSKMDMSHMDHSGHDMGKMAAAKTAPLAKAGFGSNFDTTDAGMVVHAPSEFGPHVDMHAMSPQSGLADPGIGLREHQARYGRRVLRYADLKSLHPTRDKREPSREIELHLTGNMHRYMWSINGINFMGAEPLLLTFGERVRIILVNDTMMTHPFHLHGMWSELETGDPNYIPRKHTVIVQPGSKISYLVTADAKGRWAYHCHLLYHMLGMMRTVKVV
ncbi:MAG TPA: multicopper oxidase domain-containing protein, partial [Marinagarivorans sp.]|nr:multicopper oxidase domain-containing protein [Marinagarivorans sp.]